MKTARLVDGTLQILDLPTPELGHEEALIRMEDRNTEGLFVAKSASPLESQVAGLITREMLNNYYR